MSGTYCRVCIRSASSSSSLIEANHVSYFSLFATSTSGPRLLARLLSSCQLERTSCDSLSPSPSSTQCTSCGSCAHTWRLWMIWVDCLTFHLVPLSFAILPLPADQWLLPSSWRLERSVTLGIASSPVLSESRSLIGSCGCRCPACVPEGGHCRTSRIYYEYFGIRRCLLWPATDSPPAWLSPLRLRLTSAESCICRSFGRCLSEAAWSHRSPYRRHTLRWTGLAAGRRLRTPATSWS